MDFDFVNYSRRTLLLFVFVADVIALAVFVAVIWAGCELVNWVMA